MRRLLGILTLIAMLSLALPGAYAQSIFADLSGTVTDTSGAVVPGAKVTVQNAASKVARRVTSDKNGFFSLSQLPAGTYNVIAEAQGFQKWVGNGIVLNASDNKTVQIGMRVGAATETVEVSAEAGEVAITDTGEKSDLISSKELNELSLVGRNATEFLKILPGASLAANGAVNKLAYTGEVVGINGFAVNNNAGGLAGVSVNGQSGQNVAITQDGQNVFDPGAAGAATPVNPNPDMISEVKVLTSNFNAENAQGPVVVNTVTKSGGANFHGDVHFYARNAALNSEDAFNKAIEGTPKSGFAPGQLKGPSSYYYPGFSIGGPVLIPGTNFNKARKKVFFFESYENYHQDIDGGIDRSFVPTDAMLNGDFSALNTFGSQVGRFAMGSVPVAPSGNNFLGWNTRAAAGCTINGGVMSQQCIDPNALLLMKNYLPAPTTPNGVPDANGYNYTAIVTEKQNSYQNVARGDVDITENTKAYVTWSRQRETANMPLGLWNNSGDWVVPAPSATIGNNASDFTTVSLLHVFSPTLTAEARFGYTKVNFPSTPADKSKLLRKDLNYPLTGVFNNPDTPAILSWGQSIPNLGDIGHDYHPTMIAVKGIPSASGDVTKVFRTHQMKYGFYYEKVYNKQDNWGQFMGVLTYDPWNTVSGNNYADMLMGIGNDGYFEQALPPPTNLAQNIAAFYAQDNWKVTRRISVQYGMRFEHYAKPYADNPWGIAIFNPALYDANTVNSGISWHSLDHSIPLSGTKSRLFYYSPRVGAAIDIFGTGKTVVRGGWGKYRAYDSIQSNSYTGPGQTSQGSVGWSCGFNSTDCPTWEAIDTHASGNCTAASNCAPAIVFGQEPVFTNGSFSTMDPRNDEQPLITSYSLSIDQELPARFKLETSYVGNHTDFMQGTVNINAVPLGALFNVSCSPTDTSCQQSVRPFSNYQNITQSVTAGKAQYDSLQASLSRNVGFVTLQANYTFSKALGDGVAVNNGGLSGAFPDYGVHEYWSVLPLDRAHVFSAAYVFNVPKIHSSAWLNGFANGWQISGITQIETGSQISATNNQSSLNFGLSGAAGGVALLGTPDVNVYANLTCNPATGLGHNQFANPNCFSLPTPGAAGDGRIPYIAGPMFWNSDLTLLKNIKITERQSLEFRFAAFNFLNHDLLSFTNADNNLKLNFNDQNQVITGASMVYPGNGLPAGDPNATTPTLMACQASTIGATINGVTYPNGIRCAGTSTFGKATYNFGHRILEFGVRYSF